MTGPSTMLPVVGQKDRAITVVRCIRSSFDFALLAMSEKAGKRAPPPQLIFDDGSRVMQEEAAATALSSATPLETPASIRGSVSLEDYYEIDRISQELMERCQSKATEENEFRIALQFPDELLDDSPEVCWLMEARLTELIPSTTTPFVFCLGDTTVGACCPDEVAALHLQADLIVHYGHACLSPTGTLPVIYSFGRLEMDVANAVDCICKEGSPMPHHLLILYHVGYQHAMEILRLSLNNAGIPNVAVGKIPEPTKKARRAVGANNACCNREHASDNACCRGDNDQGLGPGAISRAQDDSTEVDDQIRPSSVLGGLELPESIESWGALSEYTILYVGESESTSKRQYVNIMLRLFSLPVAPKAYWTYSPKAQSLSTSIPVALQKQLNRRFFLTQKARDANVMGILVSNLSQQHLVEVVKTLQARIHDAGKSSYSFAVGKINPAKLANFAEIECFVLVACREHSLLNDEREYHVPVITPLELDVALGNLEWGAQAYSLDCQDVLGSTYGASNESQKADDEEDDAPYFSLVTGKYVEKSSAASPTDLDLKHLPGRGQVTAYKSEAANFLKQREYQGLNTLAGQTEAKAAVVGQRGIASDYGES